MSEAPLLLGLPAVTITGLLLLRIFGLLAMQVMWRRAVGAGWWVLSAPLSLLLAVALAPSVGETSTVAATSWPTLLLCELGLGVVIGLVASLPGYALLGATDAAARIVGAVRGPWRALVFALVAATALGLGLHHPLLLGLRAVVSAWPVGQPGQWLVSMAAVDPMKLAHGVTMLALSLATPVLLAAAVVEGLVRVVTSGTPQAMVLGEAAAPWLRAAAALVAVGASWAAYDYLWATRALGLPG